MSSKHDEPFNIALSGHFGENNVGDDILLLALVDGLSKSLNLNHLVIFTADVAKTESLLAREKCNNRSIRLIYSGRWGVRQPDSALLKSFSWLAHTVAALKKSDLHLIGPGTIIKDSNRYFVVFWLIRALWSLILRRSFSFIGIGVGEIRFWHSRLLIRWLMNKAQFISVRDTSSLEELGKLNVHRPFMATYPDLSFIFRHYRANSRNFSQIKRIGLNFRKFKAKHFPERAILLYEKAIIDLLRSMPDNVELVFYSFCNEPHQNDLEMFEFIQEKFAEHHATVEKFCYRNLVELRDGIASCDAFIGTRYHSVLLAVQACVPTIGLSYERKIINFMADIGVDAYALDIASMNRDDLLHTWEKLLEARHQYEEHLQGIVEHLGIEAHSHLKEVHRAVISCRIRAERDFVE